jgi:hypothetical protein
MRKIAFVLVTVFGFALSGAAYAGGGCSHGGGIKTTEGYSPITPDTTTTSAPTSGTEKTKG